VEPTPAEAAFVFFIRCAGARRDEELLEYVYVLLRADVLKLLRQRGTLVLKQIALCPSLPSTSTSAMESPGRP
jgi:hypothetical protein